MIGVILLSIVLLCCYIWKKCCGNNETVHAEHASDSKQSPQGKANVEDQQIDINKSIKDSRKKGDKEGDRHMTDQSKKGEKLVKDQHTDAKSNVESIVSPQVLQQLQDRKVKNASKVQQKFKCPSQSRSKPEIYSFTSSRLTDI